MGGCVSSTSTPTTRPDARTRPQPPQPSIPLTDLAPPPAASSSNDITATNSAHPSDPTLPPPASRQHSTESTLLPKSTSRYSLGSLRKKRPSENTMSNRAFLNALRQYATLPNPRGSLPANTLLFANSQCIAIFDAFPKAKYHFLVLPRHPFPSMSDPESHRSLIKLDHLDDLQSLLLKPSAEVREEVITAMMNTAREVEEMVRDEMVKTEGFEWKVDVGFHAVPSMKRVEPLPRHVHLHVISEDRISTSYKTKKHHNSFRPDLGFFLDIMEVERWIKSDEQFLRERARALPDVAAFLDSPLACFKCDEIFSNMPKLKAHLEKEWKDEKTKALDRIRRTGRQYRSSDEDDIF